jgi:hypothetical protein
MTSWFRGTASSYPDAGQGRRAFAGANDVSQDDTTVATVTSPELSVWYGDEIVPGPAGGAHTDRWSNSNWG